MGDSADEKPEAFDNLLFCGGDLGNDSAAVFHSDAAL